MNQVLKFLDQQQIKYLVHRHPAVYTCEEASKHCQGIPGIASKTLLLRDQKKQRYFLVIVAADKRLQLKKLAQHLQVKRLSFASTQSLQEKLKVTPGSVSPFGLINDPKQTIEVYLDQAVAEAQVVSFHPNDNTATVELSQKMFQRFLSQVGHQVKTMQF
ncbi:MAG: prolyl-tRNA synthetase associated domain-containing protein [Candidatus Pacebacteria bacterium]|nr:prolyl-tRNA synthetase associated domain-containing protein [Candidatus Paceibacterota bacterium]